MDQPARLEENLLINPIKSSTKMASGSSRPCHSLCQNLPPLDPVEDEFARDPGRFGSPHSGNTSPAPSRNPTPGPNLIPALIPAPVSAPVPALALAPAVTKDLFK